MASLKEFSKRIQQVGKEVEVNTNKAVKQTASLAQQVVILSTPVDTGRARGNWIANAGSPITSPSELLSKSGAESIAANYAVIQQTKLGESVYISNNLPYINRLNDGYSAQAPAGFVQKAVQPAISAIRQVKLLK